VTKREGAPKKCFTGCSQHPHEREREKKKSTVYCDFTQASAVQTLNTFSSFVLVLILHNNIKGSVCDRLQEYVFSKDTKANNKSVLSISLHKKT